MKVLIFDLDDTLLMSNSYEKYSDIVPNNHLKLLFRYISNPIFIYTNGTIGHAIDSLNGMECYNSFKDRIYARDTIPFMKPYFKSFNHVNNSILYDYGHNEKRIFFDDLQHNLLVAKNLGWETVWISPEADNNNKLYYIDHAYTHVIDALYSIDLN